MSKLNLTPDAVQTLEKAVMSARTRHNIYLSPEHLMLGALETESVRAALQAAGSSADQLLSVLNKELGMIRNEPLEAIDGLGNDTRRYLNQATAEADDLNQNYLDSAHIMLALLKYPDAFLKNVLSRIPELDVNAFQQYVQQHVQPPSAEFLKQWRNSKWEHNRLLNELVKPDSRRSRSSVTRVGSPAGRQTVHSPHQTVSTGQRSQQQNDSIWMYVLVAVVAFIVTSALFAPHLLVAFGLVVAGWVVSLTLHEFGHALVAYWGGDHTVVEKGYLTLNPLKYTHPLLSIGLPMLFLALGGIGLPGGAVYIERHRLRNRWWGAAVSAAGPFATFLCMVIFAAPFWSGYVTVERFWQNETLWAAVAFLVWLQGIAIVINLLPIPPLDGFGIVEPFLPEDTALQFRVSLGSMGLFLILFIFFTPLGGVIADQADIMTDAVMTDATDIDHSYSVNGYYNFRFWDDPS